MPLLRLIIGPPGSGKTYRVLREAAQALLEVDPAAASGGALSALSGPALLVISPEQQAVQLERSVLSMLETLSGRRAASRLRVLSFSRLTRLLQVEASAPYQPGELGRSLLCWRVLLDNRELLRLSAGPRPAPFATLAAQAAPVLAALAAELELYGTTPEELRRAAREGAAAGQAPRLELLADFLDDYQREAARLGLSFTPPAARVAGLLEAQSWPLSPPGLRVWVDGFASFTPAEESALGALLAAAESLTATLLLDPARLEGPLYSDVYDWYAPTREQLARWRCLAAKAGAAVELEALEQPRRWSAGSALAWVARQGPQPGAGPATAPAQVGPTAVSAHVSADSAAEAQWAAGEVLALTRGDYGDPLRFGEISLVCRSLELYRAPLELALAEHGIPCFIDQRVSLAHHPAAELLRSGLRLALGEAGDDDPAALLAAGLLPAPEGLSASEAGWQLSAYGRQHELSPWHWLEEAPWRRWRRYLRRESAGDDAAQAEAEIAARLAELDAWRRAAFAPVRRLREAVHALADAQRSVGAVLGCAWDELLGAHTQAVLDRWAAEAPDAEQGALHTGVGQALAGLFDELLTIAGSLRLSLADSDADPGAVTAALLCRWVEAGLAQLSLGFAPPRLDSVLVTGIERGRHGQVRASLLLGLSAGLWPLPAGEGALLDSAARAQLNAWAAGRDPGRRLLGGGAQEAGAREPYFALVAATRPSDYLRLSRPAADAEGRELLPSPWFSALGAALPLDSSPLGQPERAATPAAAVRLSALRRGDAALRGLAERLAERDAAAQAAWAGLRWAQREEELRSRPALPAEELAALYGRSGARRYQGSVSRLEAFARCPFMHFARHCLHLSEERPLRSGQELGLLYHSLLEHAFGTAAARGIDWREPDPALLRAALNEALEQAGQAALAESGRRSTAYLLERAGLLLEQVLASAAAGLAAAGRVPLLREAGFGQPGAPLPPLEVQSPAGPIRLSGYIDRVDLGPDGAVVTDYKTRSAQFRWTSFLAGEQLQLPAYLLAIEGRTAAGAPPLQPRGLALQRIEPQWQAGVAQFKAAEPLVPGARSSIDAEALARQVLVEARRIIAELGARILEGDYLPLPLRQGEERACAHCAFRPVCRFDPQAGGAYRLLRGSSTALRDALAAGADLRGSAQPGWESPA